LALIGHLDTLRLLERALRRSQIPISHTGGFHPLPRIHFGQPLPLGSEGLAEWLDLELIAPLQPQAALTALQSQLPSEFQLLTAQQVALDGPSLSALVTGALWQFGASMVDGLPAPNLSQWQAALTALLAASELPWQDTDKKGRPRQRDYRQLLLDLHLVSPTAAAATPVGPGAPVLIALESAITPQGLGLKPDHLCLWLSQQLGRPLRADQPRRLALNLSGDDRVLTSS
jgi:radical SAM-linked protein